MEETRKKYTELEEKADIISSVGKKLCDLVEQNLSSICFYEGEIAKAVETGQDNKFYASMIVKLEKENELLRQIESQFWASHVF